MIIKSLLSFNLMKKNKQKSDKLVWCEMGERIRIKKKKTICSERP